MIAMQGKREHMKLHYGDDWRDKVIRRLIASGKLHVCKACGKPFKPNSKSNYYCTPECRKSIVRTCDICGAEFNPKQENQLRCSWKCRQEANRRNSREYMRIKRRKVDA